MLIEAERQGLPEVAGSVLGRRALRGERPNGYNQLSAITWRSGKPAPTDLALP